jgi:hypothetical protein
MSREAANQIDGPIRTNCRVRVKVRVSLWVNQPQGATNLRVTSGDAPPQNKVYFGDNSSFFTHVATLLSSAITHLSSLGLHHYHALFTLTMETRAKSRRQEHPAANPDPPAPSRTARQNGPSQSQSSNSQPSQSQSSQPSQPKAVGLGALPFARRGARATERAASIASIQTVPYRPDEETVVDEGETYAEIPADDGFASSSYPTHAETDSEERITKFRIMQLSLGDLASSTDALMQYLQNANFDSGVFRGRLKIKRNAFDSVRESFSEEDTAPFIDWTQTQDMWKSQEEAHAAATVIVCANVATALYEITALQTSTQLNSFPLLDRINSFFHLFADPQDMFRYPQFPELLLDIRTWYLIESLEGLPEKPSLLKHIASVFCEPVEGGDIYERLASGPYRGLGEASNERVEELVSSRIQEIVPIMQRDKQTHGAPELKETFPLETLLDQIGTWLVAMYGVLRSEENSQSQTQERPESAKHSVVGDDFEDSQTTVSESQPIARVAGNEPRSVNAILLPRLSNCLY